MEQGKPVDKYDVMETFLGTRSVRMPGVAMNATCSLLQPMLIFSRLKYAAFCSLRQKGKNAAFCSRIFLPVKFVAWKRMDNFAE